MTPQVVLVGNTVADLFTEVGHFPQGSAPEFGPASLVVTEHAVRFNVGGNAGRAAGLLARLGTSVQLFTRLGTDVWGRLLRSELERDGVEVVSSGECESSSNFVATQADGNRVSFFYPGEPDYGSPSVGPGTKFVAIAACPFPKPSDIEGWYRAVLEASMPVLIDPGPALVGRPALRDLASLSGPGVYLTLNSFELADLTGCRELRDGLDKAHGCGFSHLVVKLGERGAVVSTAAAGRPALLPSSPLPRASSTTVGAGDAFNAGLLHGLVNGLDLLRSAALGNRVACTALSAVWASSPHGIDVLSGLDQDVSHLQEV